MTEPTLSGKTARITSAEKCPDVDAHTFAPKTYLAWHEWAAEKAKTHVQKRCPTCALWVIWEPKV